MSSPLAPYIKDASRTLDDSSTGLPPENAPLADLVPLQDQLEDIQNVDQSIKASLLSKRGNALGLEQLAAIVQTSIDGIKPLLESQTHITKEVDSRLDECIRRLRNVDDHLHDSKAYGKSAKAKGKLRAFTCRPYDPYLPYRERLQVAFDEFQDATKFHNRNHNVPAIAITPAIQPAASSTPQIVAEPVETKPLPLDKRWATIRDTIQGVLKVATDIKDLVGEPAGPIIGLLAGTGLTIIEMLNDMEDNREDAADLGVRISGLLQIIAGFMENRHAKQNGAIYATTIKQLDSFSATLKSVENELIVLKAQGRFKQGVSHSRNKEDLQGWKASIDDARNTLQLQLSLHNVDTAEATGQGVDDLRLLGLLGDGDTGASEKVADLDDLVCLPGTREDILGQADAWLKDPSGSRVFWVSGVAGCGKSAVAATIADRQARAGARVAVFHFARANQARNKRVLCSLAHQASEWDGGLVKHRILSALRTDPHLATKPVATQFQHLLTDPLKSLPSSDHVTLLVLDALDEWDDHGAATKLLDLITNSNAHLPPTIRFALTSRNESHLIGRLTSISMQTLVTRYTLDTVLHNDVNHDIRIYVKRRFEKIRLTSTRHDDLESDWPGEKGVEALVEEANGLFQWAGHHLCRRDQRSQGNGWQQVKERPARMDDQPIHRDEWISTSRSMALSSVVQSTRNPRAHSSTFLCLVAKLPVKRASYLSSTLEFSEAASATRDGLDVARRAELFMEFETVVEKVVAGLRRGVVCCAKGRGGFTKLGMVLRGYIYPLFGRHH